MNASVSTNSIENNLTEKNISEISMLVVLISFTMLFATLFLGYALYRLTSEAWPPMGLEAPHLTFPLLSTFVIALSSYFYWIFEKSFSSRKSGNGLWLLVTGLLGVLFFVVQFLFWSSLKAQGLYVSSGIFGSIIYSFTWIHAAHIVLGLGSLLWLEFKIKKGKATLMAVRNVGKFWHFLGVIWLIMFVTIFAI